MKKVITTEKNPIKLWLDDIEPGTMEQAESISLPRPERIIQEIIDVVADWPRFAEKAHLNRQRISEITRHHRLDL